MSTVPNLGPALRRLATTAATHAVSWQPRLGQAARTHLAPLRTLHAPLSALPRTRVRAATAAGAAAVIVGGVLVAGVPANASAQTVIPTTPGISAFTSPHGEAPAAGLVQVAGPSAYQVKHAPAHDSVAVAANLAAPVPIQVPAPAPAPEPAPEPAPAPAPAPAWSAPVPNAPTSNPYGVANPEYAAGYHTGVDFAVDPGTPLLAVGEGRVVSAGWDGAYGKEVVLKLADGHFAQYAHMSELDVSAGDHVTAGEQIGASGNTGNSTGPHLHFEIRSSNHYGAVINPIAFLSGHGVTDF
ncbi:M23 family metallopeptidase [Kitasatospora indigofera]|uniref:M23 family metallopeptidase n=1 Tax=Kitasatospora indigofera TaxID=67307 RepID=UPI003625DBFE